MWALSALKDLEVYKEHKRTKVCMCSLKDCAAFLKVRSPSPMPMLRRDAHSGAYATLFIVCMRLHRWAA